MLGKRSLDEQVAQRQTQLLNFGGGNKILRSMAREKRNVIVMDEVDGMSSGDRGGMAELIKIIKKSKVPIISSKHSSEKFALWPTILIFGL